MPLVTLTCSENYYPADEYVVGSFRSPLSRVVIELAQELPEMIFERRDLIKLDPGTPIDAVQVDIKKFHFCSVNSVDIWMHVWMSESGFKKKERRVIRQTLEKMLLDWLAERNIVCKVAADIFPGPGFGFITDLATEDEPVRW